MSKEMVDHPEHYASQGIEVIDVIEAFALDFHRANALKYILRSDRKDNCKQDLEKAIWYLNRYISVYT